MNLKTDIILMKIVDVKLYIDKAVQEGYDSEIFMDVNLQHYPLRDWAGMWNEMKSIVSSYSKFGKRMKRL